VVVVDRATESRFPAQWTARTSDGTVLSEWAQTIMTDLTDRAPRVNGQTSAEYAAGWVVDQVWSSGVWDGIFLDVWGDRIYGRAGTGGTSTPTAPTGPARRSTDRAGPGNAGSAPPSGSCAGGCPPAARGGADHRQPARRPGPGAGRVRRTGRWRTRPGCLGYPYLGNPTLVRLTAPFSAGGGQLADGLRRRDFEHGIVLVNLSDRPRTVSFDHPYRRLRGGQDPVTNNGQVVWTVSVPPHDGLILLREPG
jgi:hypothetical protein